MREYAISLGRKKNLTPEILMLEMAALPVEVIGREVYASQMPKAKALIGRRDPDDAELLALALTLDVPIWSNDDDFENCGVEQFTTAEILSKLRIFRKQ